MYMLKKKKNRGQVKIEKPRFKKRVWVLCEQVPQIKREQGGENY